MSIVNKFNNNKTALCIFCNILCISLNFPINESLQSSHNIDT